MVLALAWLFSSYEGQKLVIEGLSWSIPTRAYDKMQSLCSLFSSCMCIKFLFLKLQFLSALDFMRVLFYSIIVFLSFGLNSSISCFQYVGLRSLAKFFRKWYHPLQLSNATTSMNCMPLRSKFSDWGIVPILREFLQPKSWNRVCKMLIMKLIIWDFPTSKIQIQWKIKIIKKKKEREIKSHSSKMQYFSSHRMMCEKCADCCASWMGPIFCTNQREGVLLSKPYIPI